MNLAAASCGVSKGLRRRALSLEQRQLLIRQPVPLDVQTAVLPLPTLLRCAAADRLVAADGVNVVATRLPLQLSFFALFVFYASAFGGAGGR